MAAIRIAIVLLAVGLVCSSSALAQPPISSTKNQELKQFSAVLRYLTVPSGKTLQSERLLQAFVRHHAFDSTDKAAFLGAIQTYKTEANAIQQAAISIDQRVSAGISRQVEVQRLSADHSQLVAMTYDRLLAQLTPKGAERLRGPAKWQRQ